MKISDLNSEYDKLQQQYGAKELTSIYNGGCTNNPDICFVFMNPTGRNIASYPNWKGRKSPWIGTKNIWKLFYKIGLLNENIYEGEAYGRNTSINYNNIHIIFFFNRCNYHYVCLNYCFSSNY